jgi:hypothetical protein
MPTTTGLRVRWLAPFACKSGYAQATHDYLLALHRAGVELDIVPIIDADSEDLHPRYSELLPLVGKHVDDKEWPTHVVVHTVPTYAHEFVTGDLSTNAIKVCITTWESSPIPPKIVERLNVFDHIIVPSHYNSDLFIRSGRVVNVVPHCFDSNFWTSKEGERDPSATTQFYWIGVWWDRKNPLGVLKAFYHEFRAEDNVRLVMLAAGYNGAHDDLSLFQTCCEVEDLPDVKIITEYQTDEQLLKLHQESDCFVTTHRAEGFGLGAFEACLVGNRVISTGYSGVLEFLDADEDYLTGYQLTPVISTPSAKPTKVKGISVVTKGEPIGVNIRQKWAEPDLVEVSKYMRDFQLREDKRKGVKYLQEFRNLYSYSEIAGQLIRLFDGGMV